MKKLLSVLTLSALAATSAQALEVYKSGETSLETYGRFGALLTRYQDKHTSIQDDESRIGFKVTHNINKDLQVLGGVEFRFSDPATGDFTDPVTRDAYAGLKYAPVGTLTLGRQSTTADDVALSKYAYGNNNVILAPQAGDRVAKFRSAEWGSDASGYFSFGADYSFMGSSDKGANNKSYAYGGAVFYRGHFGDFGVKANGSYYDVKKRFSDTHQADSDVWSAGLELSYDRFALATDYSHAKNKTRLRSNEQVVAKNDQKALQVAAKYAVTDDVNVFTAWQQRQDKVMDTKITQNQWALGADYKLHPQVITYAQVNVSKATAKTGGMKTKGDTETGGAIGLRVLF